MHSNLERGKTGVLKHARHQQGSTGQQEALTGQRMLRVSRPH